MRSHDNAPGDMLCCSSTGVYVDVKINRSNGYLNVAYFVLATGQRGLNERNELNGSL